MMRVFPKTAMMLMSAIVIALALSLAATQQYLVTRVELARALKAREERGMRAAQAEQRYLALIAAQTPERLQTLGYVRETAPAFVERARVLGKVSQRTITRNDVRAE